MKTAWFSLPRRRRPCPQWWKTDRQARSTGEDSGFLPFWCNEGSPRAMGALRTHMEAACRTWMT
ncbi:hypothetical protein ES332_A11G344700v1 [Gossypium tomentosum]|uniref:Uncharacterized protein n=1 Tax=Gossypium tomentosum TaxID=34277 RepID=A0A5D2NIK0_GOSTO|nr:hypothetical protein ES332_A11G344700v1 [Gossypium tomentosum]